MLYYPKIPGGRDAPLGRYLAFEKYDGTNLHWDWDRDFGWHAFGTRRDQFNLKVPLVFDFHGHGGKDRHAARSHRLHEAWPEAVVVYMQGLNTPGKLTDPEGKKP